MSAIHEAANVIRMGDRFKNERKKTYAFAEATGRQILPMEKMSKSTISTDHYDNCWHPDKLSIWNNALQIKLLEAKPELNVGVLFGDNVLDIDIDSKDPLLFAALTHYLGKFYTPFKWGRMGKPISHIAYVLQEPFDRSTNARIIAALSKRSDIRIEVRAGESKSNFFALMPGSIHADGDLVVWDKMYDPAETVAPAPDVRYILAALRRAAAAALVARFADEGRRHYYFLALTGMLVRMFKHAEDSGNPEAAMNQEEALEFIHLVQTLCGDKDNRNESFNSTWRKFVADPTIPISGGSKLAEIVGAEGAEVRNLVYRLLVDDDDFEQAEMALERFVMVRAPVPGYVDLNELMPARRITGPMNQDTFSMLYTSMKIPFGEKPVSLPNYLKHSSQVTRAAGFELRPDMAPKAIFKTHTTDKDHGYDSETLWINAWVGFQYRPTESIVTSEEVKPFLDYITEVIAGGDEERKHWVLSWIADIFQDPANKPGTLLALTGPQGSGKTMLGEIIGKIIGDAHYGKIGSIEDLTKEFNSRVHYKLFVQADETASTQRTAISRDLKEIVTGSHQMIVYKGKEGMLSFNPARYFFTSNNSGDALRVEAGNERRYTIFEVSGKRVGDMKYWEDFYEWWSQPATLRKLHTYLKQYKYKKSFIRKAFATQEKRQHQMNSLPPVVQWAITRISEGHPLGVHTHTHSYQAYKAIKKLNGTQIVVSPPNNIVDRSEWPNLVELASLTADFHDWLKTSNIRSPQPQTAVSKLMTEIRGGGRFKYNSITALRDGVKMRPKLMHFPDREEFVAGLIKIFPALAAEITAMTETAEEMERDGEDMSGEI